MNDATRHPNPFGQTQPDLFSGLAIQEPHDEERMRAMVRPRLAALLAEARSASQMPWDRQRAEVNEITFYNMANWLPPAERDSIRLAFSAELSRLKSATP